MDSNFQKAHEKGIESLEILETLMAMTGITMEDITRTQVAKKRHLPLQDSRSVSYVCKSCGKSKVCQGAPSSDVLRKCSRCKAVYYCNKSCQKKDWTTGPVPHKQCCSDFVKDREEFQISPHGEVVRQRVFPWANCHHAESGVFFSNEFLERRGLLGQNKGYWSRSHKSMLGFPHMSGDDSETADWCHGQILLRETNKLPSIAKGLISLKDGEIPNYDNPKLWNVESITSWADYCRCRNISSSSIAPLLLTNVLTVFQILFHELKIHKRPPRNKRNKYLVYILGAENELNSLPLWKELAFLLPENTVVELRFVSPAVKHLMDKAAKHFPKSHIMTCGEYVVDKSAPGGRRVCISLEQREALFHKVHPRDDDDLECQIICADAAIGLNAGIASYVDEWPDTIMRLFAWQIPFGFSEYSAYSLRYARDLSIPEWVQNFNARFCIPQGFPRLPMPQLNISLNPFHGIVGRDVALLLTPNIVNGYLLLWRGYHGYHRKG